jgi:thioredoxin 1
LFLSEKNMLIWRRKFLGLCAASLAAMYAGVASAAPQPWNEAAFLAAQAAGKPILVDIYADW